MHTENGKRVAYIFEGLLALFLMLHTSWAGSYLFEGAPPVDADFWAYHAWLLPGLLMAGFIDVLLLWAINRISRGGDKSHYVVILVAGLISAAMQVTYMAVHRPQVIVDTALPNADVIQSIVDATMIGLPVGVVLLMLALAYASSTALPADRDTVRTEIRERTLTVYSPPEAGFGTWTTAKPTPVEIRTESGLEALQLASIPVERVFTHARQNTPRSGQRNGITDGRIQQLTDGRYQATCVCGRQFTKDTEAGANNALSRHLGHSVDCKQRAIALVNSEA